ncbi:TPA: flagellar basal body P-ring protein FlgI [Vibrio vulnificus]|uniref:Flagellar P-ring protein n=1 Tax=Vibrio vulnificus TaxID=672 RepID=A0A8H9N163_VIBVL|nr:flagellar basal body P-ring protein FlgI [Vibrio vulnificus]
MRKFTTKDPVKSTTNLNRDGSQMSLLENIGRSKKISSMKLRKAFTISLLSLSCAIPFASSNAFAERIGDVTELKGIRDNQLQGVGVVIGLPNTGDRGSFAVSNLKTIIQKHGIKLPPSVSLNSRNVAAVMINATLPPFAKEGQKIDVTVSSIGNAKSLSGGTLWTNPLLGLDGNTYAVAQGQILVDGVSAQGLDGSTIDINSSSVGRIPSGATIERELNYDSFFENSHIVFNLSKSDFALASQIEKTINDEFGRGFSSIIDGASVGVRAPRSRSERIQLVSQINNLEIDIPSPGAKVTINSRTGTVTVTENITLSPVAISIGGITINVSEQQTASQPNPLSEGETVTTTNSQITVEQTQGELKVIQGSGDLQELVEALNKIGTSPNKLASIIQLLKSSGSLRAKVEVI